ncbi:MurR/RpiR family transcriptional regulator [Insolitispirillum peregrinum]|uniref:MurR/RpiR family transcriptional regulator n=1 Tax=Insolitispirillum peregrinum TaxID=80876 RepID=UPI0036162548
MDSLLAVFQSPEARRTKAGRLLSEYFAQNLATIPFETAASIAAHVGLSAMTVTRYLRELGYGSLDALKSELRHGPISSAWELQDTVDDLRRDQGNGRLVSGMVIQQIEALQSLNKLSHSPEWDEAVRRLTQAGSVFIASFQNISGIARYFSEQMSYVRPTVRYMDGLNGTYLELFDGDPAGRLLVLIDCRRFASKSQVLFDEACAAGIPVLLITDTHCDWGQAEGAVTLSIPAMSWRAWDSFMPLAALLDLLVTSAIAVQGESVLERSKAIRRLQDRFGDFERR